MISIVTASYNYEKYIKETIESILNQSYADWELIIVDDGSKDNSINVIQEYCNKDSRIKLYTHENNENRGLAETLKLGISKSSGEYVAFLESDDTWDKDCLFHKIQAIEKCPNASVYVNDVNLFGDEQFVNEYKTKQYKYFLKQKELFLNEKFDIKEFLQNNYIPTFSCVTVKKEYIENSDFVSPSKPNLDWFLWVQILLMNSEMVYIQSKDTNWRIHKDSYISARNKNEYCVFFDKLHSFLYKQDLSKFIYPFSKFLHKHKVVKVNRAFVSNFDKYLKKKYKHNVTVHTINFENINKPLLSICIPTYNRADVIKNTIDSIVSQEHFINTDEVEIVISDNCSSDNTKDVVAEYVNKFPNKVFYYRNQENIRDKNFEKVLSYGNGQYLKLSNDTIIFTENSLKNICQDIQNFIKNKPILYFSSGFVNTSKRYIFAPSMDKFLENASFGITAISSFGIWKDDYLQIKEFNRFSELQLVQTDVLLRQIKDRGNAIIINSYYFYNTVYKNKGGYNIAEVFGNNYLTILSDYVESHTLSKKAFEKEKKNILTRFINKFYFDFEGLFTYKKTGYFKFLKKFYSLNLYFYLGLLKILPKILKQKFNQ